MASAPAAPRVSAKDEATSSAPLIPERKKYVYRPAQMNAFVQDIVESARAEKVKIDVPETPHGTIKLVHTLCAAAKSHVWSRECEDALAESLPVREHHKSFLSHNMFVTMIGALVARALEQATSDCDETLDLLADRYYVRSIACHDSSKTSALEASAYAGVTAVNLEKAVLTANLETRRMLEKRHGPTRPEEYIEACSLAKLCTDMDAHMTAMADVGFKHHCENNPHHPEYFGEFGMDATNLVEAIVDGLACIFERNKEHTDAASWLKLYRLDKFRGANKELASNTIEALKLYIKDADYAALEVFRMSIFSLIGESIAWSCASMTECCNHWRGEEHSVPVREVASLRLTEEQEVFL